MRSSKRIIFLILTVAFSLAFLVRLWVTLKIKDLLGQGGDVMYLLLARNILKGMPHLDFGGWGNGYWFQPGYAAVVAFLNIFIHNLMLSGQLVSIISGALLVFPLFYLARQLFGLQAAYLSLALLIFYPGLVMISSQVITEPLFSVLFIGAVYLGYRAMQEKKKALSFWSGILIGCSFLIKETGLLIALILGGWLGWPFLRTKDKRVFVSLMIFILAVLLVISPWLIYLRVQIGEWVLVPKTGFALCLYYKFKGAILNEPATAFVTTEETKDISLFKLMLEEPGRVLKRASVNLWKVYHEILPEKIPFFLVGLLFLGLFDFRNKEANKKSIYMLSFFLPFFILYPLVSIEARYFLPLLPMAIIWMARGILVLPRKLSLYLAVVLILFLAFGLELKLEISEMKRIDKGWSKANREVGLWLKEHKDKRKPRIISRTPHAVFFAEGEYIFLPQENLERILEFARYIKADYIILDKSFKDIYPKLQSLFISTPYPLKLLYRYATANQEFLIFSL